MATPENLPEPPCVFEAALNKQRSALSRLLAPVVLQRLKPNILTRYGTLIRVSLVEIRTFESKLWGPAKAIDDDIMDEGLNAEC